MPADVEANPPADADRLEENPMGRAFVVEGEAFFLGADRVDAFKMPIGSAVEYAVLRPLPLCVVSRMGRILRKCVENVGQQ